MKKVWPADWRKSLFYQPSNASASDSSKGNTQDSKADERGTSKDASDRSSSKWESESEARKSLEQRTAEPQGGRTSFSVEKERGSGEYNTIERARRNSSTYLQGDRDSMESRISVTEVLEDIISIRIPVEDDFLPMYQEPRHIIHADMFDLVHASMWLWQEASQRVLWANRSARDAHQIVATQRVSMGLSFGFTDFRKGEKDKSKFMSKLLKDVENGTFLLYIKGQSQHILPCLSSNRKSKEATDIMELVIKPYVLRGLHQSGDEKCCLIEIVNSLSNESARDIEMFQGNTGNTFLIDLNGRILCRRHQTNTIFAEIKHFFDILSGTDREKEELMNDMQCRLYQQKEESIFLTEQSDSTKKWCAIEARKSRDPVTYKDAFVLCVSDVTDMRNAEQTLISGFHTIKEENDSFWDDQRQGLRLKDHSVLQSETANMRKSIQLSPSPAEMVSQVLDELIDGNQVSRNRLMFVQQVFSGGGNCYQPLNFRNALSMDLGDQAHRLFWELLGEGPDEMKFKASDENDRGRQWRRESLDMHSDSTSAEYKWYMNSIFSWDFDVFKFAERAKGKPLTILAMFLMESEGLIKQFDIEKDKLRRYLSKIESGYPDNPYHNRIHACGVLHMTYMLISKGGMSKTEFQPQAILCCFLAAITHDFDHPGKTSDYLIRTGDKLALVYNDTSPLENYHMSSAWTILMQPKYNFLDKVSDSVKKSIRETWIELVMATDMKKHLGIVAQFKSRTMSRHTNTGSGTSGRDSLHDSEGSNRVTLQMIVKIADLGHLACSNALHRRWVSLLEEELFRQGDLEKREGLSVSTFMDRSQNGISKSQAAFFEVIALPTFETFANMFERTGILYERVKENYNEWLRENK